MAEIIWTKKAKNQLEKAAKYIKDTQGLYYADIIVSGIFEHIEILKTHPKIGQREPILEFKKNEYRYLVKWSYKIIYRLANDADKVVISRVFHTSQHPEKII